MTHEASSSCARPAEPLRVAIRTGLRHQTLVLPGRFGFDGLRGTRPYLIQYAREGYYVRVADRAAGKLLRTRSRIPATRR